MRDLDGTDTPVEVMPGYRLVAPGLQGTVGEVGEPEEVGSALDEALRRPGAALRVERRLEVSARLRPGLGLRTVTLEAPPPEPGRGQLVLAVRAEPAPEDGARRGVATWNPPADAGEEGPLEAAGQALRRAVRAVLPGDDRPAWRARVRLPPPTEASDIDRGGGLAAAARWVLRVLSYPLEQAAGVATEQLVEWWESEHRPYRLRRVGPDDYGRGDVATLGDGELRTLATPAAPTLVLVHGAFSAAHNAFGGLPREAVAALGRAYGGRVLGFDHPTLSVSPDANARWLAERLPPGAEVDLVCHSRGGLVARAVAGLLEAGGTGARVRRAVLVGTPNAGTVVADPEHLGELLDRYTSLLNLAPPVLQALATEVLEAVANVAKLIGRGALERLEGLSAMRPGSDLLRRLNTTPPGRTEYYGVGSDFEPAGDLRDLVAEAAHDRVMDRVFKQAPNDLLVPTAGTFEAGTLRIPEPRHLRIGPRLGVTHFEYFTDAPTVDRMLGWLSSRVQA